MGGRLASSPVDEADPQMGGPPPSRRPVRPCSGGSIPSESIMDESPEEPPHTARPSVRISSGLWKAPSPLYTVAANPVVRPAWETPVPYRRVEGDGLAVERQLPRFGIEGSHHFVSASATAHMYDDGVVHRDVSHAVIQFVREMISEFMPDGVDPSHVVNPRSLGNCR